MIILDTNVVSEVMSHTPNPAVMEWLRRTPTETLAITSLTVAEIEFGLARLPIGKRRDDLRSRFDAYLARGFADRVLYFDDIAARQYAVMAAHRMSVGRPFDAFDLMIAAIARARNFEVATRDEDGFADVGVTVINPWDVAR